MRRKNQYRRERGKPEEEAGEAVRKRYRNIWLFLIAFGLLPLLGYGSARGAGALGGFFLGIVVIILYPVVKGK